MQEALFILFLDPETRQFYSFCEQKGILVKQNIPPQIEHLKENDLKCFSYLLKWDTKVKAQHISSYQTRPIPIGYLTPRKNRYPVYSTDQPIKQAFLEQIKLNNDSFLIKGQYKESIEARVYLGSIREQILPAKKVFTYMNTQYINKIDIKLITSPNQVIRAICRNILQEYKIIITTNSDTSRLILKVKNREEYMLGNDPISHYSYVRECLKNNIVMEIEIIESEINAEKEQFQKFIFYRKLADLEKDEYDPFPWERILKQHNGFLMWYRPDPYYIDRQAFQKPEGSQLERSNLMIQNKIEVQSKNIRMKIPRYLLKQNIEKFVEKRREEIKKKIVSLDGATIFSGECSIGYWIKIVGIKDLYSLLIPKKYQEKNTRRNILKLTSSKQTQTQSKSLMTSHRRYTQMMKFKQRDQPFPIIPYQASISIEFFNSGEVLYEQSTQNYLISNHIEINESIKWGKQLSDLMLETSLIFKIKLYSKQGEYLVCGVGVLKLFDEYGFLKQGEIKVQMYAQQKIQLIQLGCYNNKWSTADKMTIIILKLPSFRFPVRWSLNDPASMKLYGYTLKQIEKNPIDIQSKISELTKLLNYDPLKMLKYTAEDKKLLRLGKNRYKHQSNKLINYLYSIDWSNSIEVAEAYQALRQWAPLKPIQGLFLLSPRLTDEKIRFFAVKTIEKMKNSEFCLYSNQITQTLVSFETHDNPLIDLIIERSCSEPFTVGQEYFWQFWNRKDEEIIYYRFNLYLETLILTSPCRQQYLKQIRTYKTLVVANSDLVRQTQQMYFYQKDQHFKSKCRWIEDKLLAIDPKGFSFPLSPQLKFKHLIRDDCRMFDSKKLPFSLCCANNLDNIKDKKEKSYKIMFKSGDDIKQDHLILQILTVFENLWADAGYDLKMNIYRVLSVDKEIGFIEIVDDSENSSKIHKDYAQKIMEALDDEATLKFLKQYNKKAEEMIIARENFIRSSAAYLVATYVLGIGDRHSGNYMVQKNGKFFHIDFGHILGNFKTKLGIERQRTPFIFTSQFAFVMDGEKSKHFARFQRYCSNAYNILRKNSGLIINLFSMMIGAKIPQIESHDNIQYIVDKLNLDISQLQAEEHLIKEIKKTLKSESRKYNNFFHQKMRFD